MFIVMFFWVPSIVLNVMSIHTLRSIVVSGDGTPDSFVGIQVKF